MEGYKAEGVRKNGKTRKVNHALQNKEDSDVEGGLDVSGAVAVEAGGGDGLGKDDADGNEDCAGSGSEGNSDFEARAFWILISAAEAEAALGEIFAHRDFFLKAAMPNGGEDTGLDARTVAPGNDPFIDVRSGHAVFWIANFGLRFDPNGRRVAKFADARDAFADFEGFQLDLVEIDDFAALAETAFHEKARESFFTLMRGRELDVPEIGAGVKNVNSVEEVVGRVLVDFGNDAGAGVFPLVTIKAASEVELLAHRKLFCQAEDAAIAAYKQSFGVLRDGGAGAGNPRCLDGHAESYAVTLAESVRECSHGAINESPAIRLPCHEGAERLEKRGLSFQVITRRQKRWGHSLGGAGIDFLAC